MTRYGSTVEVGGAPPVEVHPSPVPPAPLTIHEDARSAGCYTFVAEVWSVDESHPELTRQIRLEADPHYVPLLCRRIYLSPAGTEVSRTYHVIGKYIPFPTEEYRDAYVRLSSVPRGFPFPANMIQPLRTLWAPWEKGTTEYENNTPPAEVEFGPWVVEQMRALRKLFDLKIRIEGDKVVQEDTTARKLKEILEAESVRDEKMVEAARREARYRMRHNWKQLKEAADNGRWSPEPPEASPFCDMGKKGA